MYKTVLLILFFNIFCDIACGITYYPCSKKSNKGEPIQIVTFNKDKENNKFELNSTGLESILLQPEVSEKELVILSIAGSFRKGKSFFLDLLLQYLENDGNLEINKLNLTHGFHWRGGSEHDTQGMLMWSEPFCVKSQSGKELAILLMDTQGAFDSQQTFGDTSTIFALSFLTSSIQLYNLKEQIQEDDLQNLQVFTTYGSQISGDGNMSYKPFQELIFLVRDWPYPQEKQYGAIGGQQYLEKIMSEVDKPEKGKILRHDIESSFTNLSCFLMPYPGEKVASGKFAPSDIKSEFIKNLNDFAAMLFNPEKLVIKQIGGKNISGRMMFDSLKLYVDAFANNEKLKPETIHEATCRANNGIVFGEAKVYYNNEINKKCFQTHSFETNELQQYYEKVRKDTIEKYNNTKQSRCEESSKGYLIDLEKWIEELYGNCTTENMLTRIKELTEQLKKCDEEKVQLKGSIENFKEQLSNITKKLNFIEKQQVGNEKELDFCTTQLKTCTTQLKNCTTEKEEKTEKLDTCTPQLFGNKTELDSCTTQLKTCTTEKEEKTEKLDTCTPQLFGNKTELDSCTTQLKNCTTEKKEKTEKLDTCTPQLVGNKTAFDSCTTQLKTCNTEKEENKGNLDTCKTKKEANTDELYTCTKQLKTYSDKLATIYSHTSCSETSDCPYLTNYSKYSRACYDGVCGYK